MTGFIAAPKVLDQLIYENRASSLQALTAVYPGLLDLNTDTNFGMGFFTPETMNTPNNASWGICFSFVHGGSEHNYKTSWCFQVAFTTEDDFIYYRKIINDGNFSEWRKI